MKLFQVLVFSGLLSAGLSVYAADDWEMDSVYQQISRKMMPALYETVEGVLKNKPCDRYDECIFEQAKMAYWLWTRRTLKNPLVLQFPAAMAVVSQISPAWFSKTLESQEGVEPFPFDDIDRPRVHIIMDQIFNVWGEAALTNPSLTVVRNQINNLLHCTMQDCSQWAESQLVLFNLPQQDAVKLYIECAQRQEVMPGLLFRHLCDLFFNRFVFIEADPYSV